MVRARQLPVLPDTRHDVVHLEPQRLPFAPPRAHRVPVRRLGRAARARWARRRLRTAACAAVLVAPFDGPPRDRPPMVGPKRVAAAVAAPGTPTCRQRRAAPAARARSARRRKGTGGEKSGALRRRRLSCRRQRPAPSACRPGRQRTATTTCRDPRSQSCGLRPRAVSFPRPENRPGRRCETRRACGRPACPGLRSRRRRVRAGR